MCGIYKITNTTNGKAYVGQSVCIKTRWKQHRCDAFNPKDPAYEYPLYRAFRDIPKRNSSLKMPVEQIDPVTNKVIATYTGVTDAARAFGRTNGNQISKACNGKAPSAYGYLWRFASSPTQNTPSQP